MSNSLSFPPLDYQHETKEEDWKNGRNRSGPTEETATGESVTYINSNVWYHRVVFFWPVAR